MDTLPNRQALSAFRAAVCEAAGNRTTLTTTDAVNGLQTTQSSYDAADELLTSTSSLSGTTSYIYDGNGNQTGSDGPLGTVVNTRTRG
jgi:YD repeat-containing protein